jgi:hypothetical protein
MRSVSEAGSLAESWWSPPLSHRFGGDSSPRSGAKLFPKKSKTISIVIQSGIEVCF